MRSKKALVNIISSLILQIVSIICGFIVPKLIISSFGSNVNGLIVSITQFLAYITLLESGFGPVIKSVLYKPIANKDKNTIEKILKTSEKIFKTISYIFIVYILLLCICLPLIINNEFDNLFTISLIIIIGISTFAEYYFGMTYRLYLQAEQKTYVISFIQIVTLILNTVLVVLLINFKASIHIVKIVSSLVFVLRPIIQNIYVKKKFSINLSNVKETYIIKQKWDGLAQHIAYVVHNNTDIVILTLCGNLLEVSVYSIYIMIINCIRNIVRSFTDGIDASFGDMIAKGEQESLNKNFKTYESLYFTIATILYTSMLFLIVPFVKIYTSGITDANYIRPIFAYIMIFANFTIIIRQPYNDLVKVAGHFKRTKIGAWVEAITNIVISFILVWKFGLIGVAIGTLAAILIRTIEFICYTSKHILKRNIWCSVKRLIIIGVEIGVLIIINLFLPHIEVTNYFNWIIEAIIVVLISAFVIITINYVIYKDDIKNIIELIKKIFITNKKEKEKY